MTTTSCNKVENVIYNSEVVAVEKHHYISPEKLTHLDTNADCRVTTNKKEYECSYLDCNKVFSKPSELTYHIDSYHLKLKWFTCIYKNCDKSFYYTAHMNRHLRTHRPKSFYCELCYQYFSRKDNLKFHKRKCSLVLVCSVCSEMFLTSADIDKHRESHCVYLKCLYKDCFKHLAPANIREHLLQHCDIVKCPLCINMYCDAANLEIHMNKDHNTRYISSSDYQCDIDINTWFQTSFRDIDKNVDYDKNEPNVGTDYEQGPDGNDCPGFDNIEGRYNSKGTHRNKQQSENANTDTNSVMYYCNEPNCKYSTPTPRWLKKHSLKHRNFQSGKHKCNICNKVMGDKWSLKLHMNTHDVLKKYSCQMCTKKYTSQSRLAQHCQTSHPKARIWSCDECPEKFSTAKRLMLHYKQHIEQYHHNNTEL